MVLQDFYNTGANTFSGIGDTRPSAQIFTASSSYALTSIRLLMYKVGSPGTITVSIRNVTGEPQTAVPTGPDLESGTTDGNTLTVSTDGEWRETTLDSPFNCVSGNKYAIVVICTASPYAFRWMADDASPTYLGGNTAGFDNDSNWLAAPGRDFMFETYGEVGGDFVELSATIEAVSGMSAILTVGDVVDLSATIAAVSTMAAILTVPTVFKTTNIATIKRVVVAGNDEIWFEDI